MNKKQDIVPVQSKDDQKKYQQQSTNRFTQKLVARLKCNDSELFIYDSIHESTLKILLTELNTNEAH